MKRALLLFGLCAAAPARAAQSPEPAAAPAAEPPAPEPAPVRLETLTVVGTRETRTAGSAHVLKTKELERHDQDNPEAVVKMVPGVYARGEDGLGLRPNIGIRGTSPDRSKKITLMEDGVLFAPAPYSAPAAYYFPQVTRMTQVRVIKGPGAVSFGPHTVGGAVDLVTRRVPNAETGGLDLAAGQFGYGKVHGHFGGSGERSGFLIEGLHLRSDGWKVIDGHPDADTGFERNEWMVKGRYQLSTDPEAAQELGLKIGYSDEDSRETYLGLTDADFRANPRRRYAASRLDRMLWKRTQIVGSYHAELARRFTLDAAVYRHDLTRSWRKVNHLGGGGRDLHGVLTAPDTARKEELRAFLRGERTGNTPESIISIGPNQRSFVAQGVQATLGWRGDTGPLSHRLELGARYHYDRIDRHHSENDFRLEGFDLVPVAGAPTRINANERAWARALALHVTDAITFGGLTLTPGLRAELIEMFGNDRLTGERFESTPQRVLIPGVGAYFALTEAFGVLAGVHRGFSPAVPSPPGTVEPEDSIDYEAGLRWGSPALRLEAIGFYNDYRNLTSVCGLSNCPQESIDQQNDAGRARILGVELYAQSEPRFGERFALPLTLAYTYTNTRFEESFTSQDTSWGQVMAGDEMPYVPVHQLFGSLGLEADRRGGLTVAVAYVSAMRENAGQGALVPAESTDASLVFDLTARLALGARGELYLHLRNALGAEDLASRRPYGARAIAPRWLQVGTKWRL